MSVHGNGAAPEKGRWRPHLGWLLLAIFVAIYSLGSNLIEIVYAYLLGDERAMLVTNTLDRVIDDAARILMYLVGAVIVWRAWGRRSTFLLGLGLASLAAFPVFYLGFSSGIQLATATIFNVFLGPLVYLLPAFAIAMLDESGVRVPLAIRWLLRIGLAYAIALTSYDLLLNFVDIPDIRPWLRSTSVIRLGVIPYFLTMIVLFIGWVRAPRDIGQRLFLLLLAVSVIISGNLLFALNDSGTGVFPRAVTNASSLLRTAGSLLFAYAILKHRVIDLGFAINRTLVYGAVTFTILAVFGLVEYLAKTTIPHAWPQAGSVITAGIAVLLFLSFHHLHHWFEHHIERLFFHTWHLAERELRRFVGSAGQFTRGSALCGEFVSELRRYAQTSEVALFLRSDDGDFCLEAGALAGASECYAEDDRAFALMRSEREPIELARAHSALPGELAVPMLDQQGLAGFVLLGAKPDGSHFRPDEEENIGSATHQIGLDLQALRAKTLDEELVSLRGRLAATEAERDRLLASMAASKA